MGQGQPTRGFAAWLRERREDRQQTQPEAAAEVGVSLELWQRWERGRPVRKVAHVVALAKWASVEAGVVIARIGGASPRSA